MMTFRNFIKSMLSGMAFPSIFLPLVYTVIYFYDANVVQATPLQFIPMYIPLIFGITNVISIWVGDRYSLQNREWQLWSTGAILGIIVAIFGIFIFHVPELVFGLSGNFRYLPFIFLPIIYGAIFRYIIQWLNAVLEI